MGSDLSVVMRTRAPVPQVVHEAREQRQSLACDVEESGVLPMLYTEFRLVCGEIFNPAKLVEVPKGTSSPPSVELLVEDTTPQTLSLLTLENAALFPHLHDALRCKQCLGRIGLVVDPSVCIGRRLYAAEQRHIFTQSFSIFLSKLVLAMKHVAPSCQESWVQAGERESPLVGDLVSTRQNSPARQNSSVPQKLFLLQLEQSLLDDVSGPWLVREVVDHMGRVLHYHSAVSLFWGLSTPPLSLPRNIPETPMSGDASSSSRALTRDLACRESNEISMPGSDAAQLGFCRSLQHVLLAQNNMSQMGLRKCLLELFNIHEQQHGSSVRFLKMIDVRENEESEATQRFVSELSLRSGVQIVIGDSGKRWRHQAPYWVKKALPYDSLGAVSMMHSLTQGTPYFNIAGHPEVNQGGNVQLTSLSCVQRDQLRSPKQMDLHLVGNKSDATFMRSPSESERKRAFKPHNEGRHNKESTTLNADSDVAAAALETKGGDMGMKTLNNISLESFSLIEGELDEERMESFRLDAAGEAEAGTADEKELLDINAGLLSDSPAAVRRKKQGQDADSRNATATTHGVKGISAKGIAAVLTTWAPLKPESPVSSSYIVGKEESPVKAKSAAAPPSQPKKGVRAISHYVSPATQGRKSFCAPKRSQQQRRDTAVSKEKFFDARRHQRPSTHSPPTANKITSGKRGGVPSTLPAKGKKTAGVRCHSEISTPEE
ncbi:hypothetical protein TraAM80_06682 [Trypanosoma rangeli]|uniref:Uncharacterized protein n=1 Tax=Trypanosoma rangeli TaxID=5698 RepID=A0A422N953_TRYRA|nr:uncharacterized protein TraAM80_06682 [Trypanosoma rangeli]RNF01962.1 hypothetical protein TraAM80_06682 [Trypanosoma rangeli]|eukprot:RNF01962.1 hypothetical protein TraAM80_06682 [Trypanosoma rangeli]